MDTINEGVQPGALEPKQKVTGKVLKTTIAGAIIDIGHELPGVIHISQLQKDPVNKVEDVVGIGQEITGWVRQIKKDRVELTMIEPLALEWREMKPEMVVKGKIVRLESYGAFVDIGGERPGLVHVSEMAHGYIKNPSEVVKEGDEVDAMILEVNRRKKQIRLSMKALQDEPEVVETPRPAKNNKRRKNKQQDYSEFINEESSEPELTAMEMAWREALERSKDRGKDAKAKNTKTKTQDQEDLLNRTLEQRVPTGN